MEPKCELHEEYIKDMRKTLYGNGREGIVSKVDRMDTTLKVIAILMTPMFIASVGLIFDFIKSHLLGS